MLVDANALGADIILVPAACTVPTGKAHWECLLRARAIENQVCILAAAQSGKFGNYPSSHLIVID